MAATWPPPACPGSGKALLDFLGSMEQGEPLDFAEIFSGAGAVHRALAALGYRGRRMDLSYHRAHDLLTPVGFALALEMAEAIKPGGLMWLAPPCSTWVWMARASTGRHIQVEGDITLETVVRNNALAERVALLLEVVSLQGGYWLLEQPRSSMLWDYPAMKAVLERHGCTPAYLHMGAYGGRTLKPTTLMGTAPFAHELARTCTARQQLRLQLWGAKTTTKWKDAHGKRRCQGTAALKGTQAYPEGFGAALALRFKAHFGDARPLEAPRHSSTGRARWAALLQQLPAEVRQGLGSAWYLRDFQGEPW